MNETDKLKIKVADSAVELISLSGRSKTQTEHQSLKANKLQMLFQMQCVVFVYVSR